MARKYAIGKLERLANSVITSVKVLLSSIGGYLRAAIGGEPESETRNVIIQPGEELPEGTKSFDLTYWYNPTEADIEAGAIPGIRQDVTIQDVSTGLSNNDVAQAILDARAMKRDDQDYRFVDSP